MYGVDWNKVVNWLLPAVLRKPKQVAWLRALISPVSYIHSLFLLYVEAVRTDVKTTGQVRSLEYNLNRLFYPSAPTTIYIEDATAAALVYAFTESENQPVYLPVFLSGQQTDFVVHCPNTLISIEARIRGFIDKYKLPTKQYDLLFDIIVG